jgi:hypothetical protein
MRTRLGAQGHGPCIDTESLPARSTPLLSVARETVFDGIVPATLLSSAPEGKDLFRGGQMRACLFDGYRKPTMPEPKRF